MDGLARRGGTGTYDAGSMIGRSGHPVQVGAILVPFDMEDLDARRDDMTWEIRDKDTVAVGQVVFCHERLKVRAWHNQNVMPGAFEVCCDSVLLMTLICGKVDEAAPHRSSQR
jgi:hypothetical protein